MIDLKFNKFKFYTEGYNVGILPQEIRKEANDIIINTDWYGDKPRFANWAITPEIEKNEEFYEELLRCKMSYGKSPTKVKNLANSIIDMKFFDTLKDSLVKIQHIKYRSIRNIKPLSMGLWDKQLNIKMHNDISDTSDFFVLVYVNDHKEWNESWGGQLNIGAEQEDGSIKLMHTHYPIDSTFVVINNSNPLIHHQVISAGDKVRYTFGFRYKIE